MAAEPKAYTRVGELPSYPAVYAMYGGDTRRSRHVAYVGIGEKLKVRLVQHLVRRDSSVTTGTSAVGLNVDYVREVAWWTHPSFERRPSEDGRKDNRPALEAAEAIAEDELQPVLRSRGRMSEEARRLTSDAAFVREMRALFSGPPSGTLLVPTLGSLIERVETLERRLIALENLTRPPAR